MPVLAYVSTPLGDIPVAHRSHTPVLDDLLDRLEGTNSPKEWALFVLDDAHLPDNSAEAEARWFAQLGADLNTLSTHATKAGRQIQVLHAVVRRPTAESEPATVGFWVGGLDSTEARLLGFRHQQTVVLTGCQNEPSAKTWVLPPPVTEGALLGGVAATGDSAAVIAALESLYDAFMNAESADPHALDLVGAVDWHELLAEGDHYARMSDLVPLSLLWGVGPEDEVEDILGSQQSLNQILESGESDTCLRSFDVYLGPGRDLTIAWIENWGHGMRGEDPGYAIGLDEESAADALLQAEAVAIGEGRDEFYAGVGMEELAAFIDARNGS